MMNIKFEIVKERARNNALLKSIYTQLMVCKKRQSMQKRLRGKFIFENRSHGASRLCIILAGYKEFIWSSVFERLKLFAPDDIDICILTSGKYSEQISDLCAENSWSYLSTNINQVCAIQNIAIHAHPKAKYIFKLDEDIFITKNYFDKMVQAYEHASQSDYKPGVIAPLIPVNGYGYVRILRKLNLIDEYQRRFGTAKIHAGHTQLEMNPETARFFGGEDGTVPSIDEMNYRFSIEQTDERLCPIRFSIGAILFSRVFWEDMGYFPVHHFKYGMRYSGIGDDEKYICQNCCMMSRPLMVSENIVVGHLGFGLQNAAMKEFYLSHPELFSPPQ